MCEIYCKNESFFQVVTASFKSKNERISKRTHLGSELSLSIRFFPSSPLSRVSLRIFSDEGPSILESCKNRSFKLLSKSVVVTASFKSKKERISKRTHSGSELSLSIRFFYLLLCLGLV